MAETVDAMILVDGIFIEIESLLVSDDDFIYVIL